MAARPGAPTTRLAAPRTSIVDAERGVPAALGPRHFALVCQAALVAPRARAAHKDAAVGRGRGRQRGRVNKRSCVPAGQRRRAVGVVKPDRDVDGGVIVKRQRIGSLRVQQEVQLACRDAREDRRLVGELCVPGGCTGRELGSCLLPALMKWCRCFPSRPTATEAACINLAAWLACKLKREFGGTASGACGGNPAGSAPAATMPNDRTASPTALLQLNCTHRGGSAWSSAATEHVALPPGCTSRALGARAAVEAVRAPRVTLMGKTAASQLPQRTASTLLGDALIASAPAEGSASATAKDADALHDSPARGLCGGLRPRAAEGRRPGRTKQRGARQAMALPLQA
jgi:hypothetical protein